MTTTTHTAAIALRVPEGREAAAWLREVLEAAEAEVLDVCEHPDHEVLFHPDGPCDPYPGQYDDDV